MRKAIGLALTLTLTLALATGCFGKPSGSPGPGQPPGKAGRQVTMADNGNTLELKVGDTFALVLGEAPPDWELTILDTAVVARVPGIMPIRGSQGVFRAQKPGTTELQAVGTYPCQKETPACKIASPFFRVTIVVKK
ncbi:MAG TPA: hypothetical protein VGK74_07825 [Symbiobacteriaceae bacterium]|jgi:predicted secreted protein